MTRKPALSSLCPLCLCGSILLFALSVSAQAVNPSQTNDKQAAPTTKSQALFQRVFGDAARFDPAMVAKVKAGKPGQRFYVDRNGDGRNDEVWFIDTDPRHGRSDLNPLGKDVQPLLVRVIDEDGDLDAQGPDLDSDLYVADYKADGSVDAIIDYADHNGDQALYEMGIYFYVSHHPFFGDDVLRVWWGRDDGGDHQLWYDVNYNYDQGLCQYRCHFSGDETFVAFGLRADSKEWLSAWENPFLFYDPDKDWCSEVVLRVEGQADQVRSIRLSFDADDDAYGRRTHDYDFSITTHAAPDKPLSIDPKLLISTKLRGILTQGWLDRDKALEWAVHAPWSQACLTWDEMNANTEENVRHDPHERWEGVIAHGSKDFQQVGGPPCSVFNKRYEIMKAPRTPRAGEGPARLRLYYDTTDRRLHLYGANEGWLNIDWNLDGKLDATYRYVDDDGDGVFDRRLVDIDGDGKVDFDWPMNPKHASPVELERGRLCPFYKYTLPKAIHESQAFIDAARAVMPELTADPVAKFFLDDLPKWMPQTHLGEYMRSSAAGARFYLDLIRDRAFAALKVRLGEKAEWKLIERQYAQGDYGDAGGNLLKTFADSRPTDTRPFGDFTRRVTFRVSNPGWPEKQDWPVAVPLRDIQRVASDFNPDNCAVVAGERYIDWREVPHQIDAADVGIGPELSFIAASLPPVAESTYYIYYSPQGKRDKSFARRTGSAEDWVPPNIGWESNRGAYRAYWGQFDFFGKKTEDLVYDNIGTKSYHGEVEWGIDALHVGTASGIGGLTLYLDGKPFLVQNPVGKGNVKFVKKRLVKGPVRAAIEIDASNIVPDHPEITVSMLCISYADRQESEIRARVSGTEGKAVLLAPGLVKLSREKTFSEPRAGFFGAWGWQEDAIGDIGMAVMTAPGQVQKVIELNDERRMPCRLSEDGKLRYWILGDWRRGRQYPIAPNVGVFKTEVTQLAGLLNREPTMTVLATEKLKE
jgi:hypothetical protein